MRRRVCGGLGHKHAAGSMTLARNGRRRRTAAWQKAGSFDDRTRSVAALKDVQAGIARAAADYERDPASITLVAVSKTLSGRGHRAGAGGGPAGLRRELREGGAAKWPAPARALSGCGTAPDRPAAIQQGEGGGGALRRHRDPRPRPRSPRRWPRKSPSRARRRACWFRSIPARSRRRAASCRRISTRSSTLCRTRYGLDHRGPDVHPAGRRPALAAFRPARRMARTHGLKTLSMGMSADYDAAIQLGATHVRVGSAISGRGGRAGRLLRRQLSSPGHSGAESRARNPVRRVRERSAPAAALMWLVVALQPTGFERVAGRFPHGGHFGSYVQQSIVRSRYRLPREMPWLRFKIFTTTSSARMTPRPSSLTQGRTHTW